MERLFRRVQIILAFFIGFVPLLLIGVFPPPHGVHFVLRVWGVYIIVLMWVIDICLSRPPPRFALLAGGFLYAASFGTPEVALLAVFPALPAAFWYFIVRPFWLAYSVGGFKGVLKALGGLVGANLTAFGIAWPYNVLADVYIFTYGDSPERTAANYIRYLILFIGYYITFCYLVRRGARPTPQPS